jgi:hypothetical protein
MRRPGHRHGLRPFGPLAALLLVVRSGNDSDGRSIVLGLRAADLDNVANAPILQDALDALDGVALAIKVVANAFEEIDVVGPIIAATAAALQRLHLREPRFPKTKHVLRDVEILGHLADGSESLG